MTQQFIEEIGAFIDGIEKIASTSSYELLFRGQNCNEPLIPKIARRDPERNSSDIERGMLAELRRRSAQDVNRIGSDDWDALVVAQHFGMSTRLLDWTSNPLIAMWFALSDMDQSSNAYIYMLPVTEELLLDRSRSPDPFATEKTYVFKPSMNNERISAQAGWFTAHTYYQQLGRFVDLHKNKDLKHKVLMRAIKGENKLPLLKTLDRLGINQESLFPGFEGTCKYLDWRYHADDA